MRLHSAAFGDLAALLLRAAPEIYEKFVEEVLPAAQSQIPDYQPFGQRAVQVPTTPRYASQWDRQQQGTGLRPRDK